MKIEPIENEPGQYSLTDGWNQFPVALSALDLLNLANQIEALRGMLEREVQDTLRKAAETDGTPTGREHLFETDMLASERRIFPWSTYPHLRIDRHR